MNERPGTSWRADEDPLAPARGTMYGIAFGFVLWLGALAIVLHLLGAL